jgi:hypothetical protein
VDLDKDSRRESGVRLALRGLDRLVKGDAEGCLADLGEADDSAERKSRSVTSLGGDVRVPVVRMCRGIALLAMDRTREGNEHIDRAIVILSKYGNQGPFGLQLKMVARLTEVLGRVYRIATRAS